MNESGMTDDLVEWLVAQVKLTQELETALNLERSALLNRNPENLQSISLDKTALLQALAAAANDMPERLGVDLEPASVERWLEHDASPAQRSAWSRLSSGLERCRTANESNGILLAARFSQVESSLRYLRDAVGGVVYGAKGTHTRPAGGQSIARA